MASGRTLVWLDRLAWILIYGGIIAVILGLATGDVHLVAGWSLGVLGGAAAAGGVVLILVRARLSGPRRGSAKSPGHPSQGAP